MRLKEWGDTKMEDVKDLLGRLLNRVDGSGISDEDLNRQINAIYSIYASAVGSEQIIVQASRFNALKYIHDENPRIRLIGMERLILESREYTHQPADDEIPAILDKLEDKLAEMLARQAVEKQLEEKIADRLDERHQEYVNEIRQEIIEEEMGEGESPANRKKMEKLEAMDKVKLTSTVMQVVRPQSLSEIVGAGPCREGAGFPHRIPVSAAPHPLRASGCRQDDGGKAGPGRSEEASFHGLWRECAICRMRRHNAPLGQPGHDEPIDRFCP